MNQTELAQIRVMINEAVNGAVDAAVNRVVQPIREELDALKIEAKGLEADTRKHSGEHKDLTKHVESTSQNDMKQDAAIAQLVVDVSAMKQDMVLVKEAQASAKNERQVTAAMTQDLYDDSKKFFARHPALANSIVGLVTAVVSAITILISMWTASRGH